MSLPLFKTTFKKNWVLGLIFTLVLMMYSGVMISMFDPASIDNLMKMFELFPPEIMSMLGFAEAFTDMTGYLASWLYGLLMIGFPMVYSIMLGNKLIAKTVDNGSIVCLLSTPDSRVKIALTKAIYAIISMIVILGIVFIFNITLSNAMFPGSLDIEAFTNLNITVLLVNITVMAITFFCSCLFSDTKYSIGFGAGIPLAFLLIKMLSGVSDKLDFLTKISIFGWYDPMKIASGEIAMTANIAYIVIAIVLFVAGIMIFKRKRLAV